MYFYAILLHFLNPKVNIHFIKKKKRLPIGSRKETFFLGYFVFQLHWGTINKEKLCIFKVDDLMLIYINICEMIATKVLKYPSAYVITFVSECECVGVHMHTQ
jgi:hypothetical protein